MKLKHLLLTCLTALAACGAPGDLDVGLEIVTTSEKVIGKPVFLKKSDSLKSGSLSDAAQLWTAFAWTPVDAEACKAKVPSEWATILAFEDNYFDFDPKGDQIYKLRLCATQLNNPKRIGAIGYIVSSTKAAPPKP